MPGPAQAPELVIGVVHGTDAAGALLLSYPGCADPMPALASFAVDAAPIGSRVGVLFVGGDRSAPLAVGLLTEPVPDEIPLVLEAEPEQQEFSAARELILRCGRASIVLTRAGKILVRGTYISHRSSGMNRITGASVQIN